MSFVVEAERVIRAPRARVFEVATSNATLMKCFRGLKPLIPGIEEATIEGGGPAVTGSLRPVKLTDGTKIKERILLLEAPSVHRYDMLEMNLLQRLICENMISEWRFLEEGDSTRIVWRYEILPRNVLVEPVTWIVSQAFRRAMQDCLDRIEVS